MIATIESSVKLFCEELGEQRGLLAFARSFKKLTPVEVQGKTVFDLRQVEDVIREALTADERNARAAAKAEQESELKDFFKDVCKYTTTFKDSEI